MSLFDKINETAAFIGKKIKSKPYIGISRYGSDPEFLMLNDNGTYLIHTNPTTAIGVDGGGVLTELRPAPAYNVQEHLSNIKALLESPNLNYVRDKKWRAGACVEAIQQCYAAHIGTPRESDYRNWLSMGGHIHIEIPYGTAGAIPAVEQKVFQARLDAFDHVTRTMEAADLLPREESALRRSNGGYGAFGNYHSVNGADGQQRVEYRTPCSWLFSPKNAFILFTAIKLAAVSPITVKRRIPENGTPEKIWEGFVKLFRDFQHIDHDSYIAVNRICKAVHASNLERLGATKIVDLDFKAAWSPAKVEGK